MTLALVAALAFGATLLGGIFALQLRDRLHLILGFSAGAVVAVAFFDLMPEALELAGQSYALADIAGTIALGFLLYLVLDRFIFFHGHNGEGHEASGPQGALGALALSLHSFLDGIGIGLAFQVSPAVGLVVTAAVLMHDFSDGINTVSMVLRRGGTRRNAMGWLWIDALAPVAGIALTLFITVSGVQLGLLLSLFAGFFLYIGASDLIPESHHAHPTFWTTLMTILGALVLFGAIRIAG